MTAMNQRLLPFNSRPHEEVDDPAATKKVRGSLSIHDLTRRSTGCIDGNCSVTRLSIHDLTRRSTILTSLMVSGLLAFNSRPHEEVDYGRRP